MAIQTDKLAPRILVNENDIESKVAKRLNKPITLMFGFAPIGRTCEMVVCNNANDIHNESTTSSAHLSQLQKSIS